MALEKQNKHSILIVEDEDVNYLYLKALIKDFEDYIKTIHAKHGQEAVKICKDNSDIDLVLMDIKMPVMNGYEATKLIKKFRPKLPIVVQTAYTTQEDKDKAKAAGCDNFISKPINGKTINSIITKYLKVK
ncbi:MAG: response regulator [Bacteroidales bacterium]|nr:response regulator [Bacteroidales bacterium]